MPIFVDRHQLHNVSAAGLAEAHQKDLAIQDRFGVRFLTYWYDAPKGTAFCLIDAPDIDTAMRVHQEAHGHVGDSVIEVDLSAVEAFLGRVSDPAPATPCAHGHHNHHHHQGAGHGAAAAIGPAERAILFTDIVDSTAMTARLGDQRAMEMVRAHDALVRRALKEHQGREVKHTGDGIMAAFECAHRAVAAARAIQQAFEAFNLASREPLTVRIGIDLGEPIADSDDLFGATVQIAARLCEAAEPGGILISEAVRTRLQRGVAVTPRGAQVLKGFAEAVEVFEVGWR